MSKEELRSQISEKEDDITRVEEDAAKKDAGAEKKIEADWDPKINETKVKLDTDEVDLKEATEKATEWVSKKNKLTAEVKALRNQYNKYLKGKEDALKKLLNQIDKEKKIKIKTLEKDIKNLQKKIEKLEVEELKQQES